MNRKLVPLLTSGVNERLLAVRDRLVSARDGHSASGDSRTERVACSLDLGRSEVTVSVGCHSWQWNDQALPVLESCKARTIYYWSGVGFLPVSRFTTSLVKLVPTVWGPPTFEIDGIKMLPSARVSPFLDAERKVGLIQPQGKLILDTCGGLGYFAVWCLRGGAARVLSYEKNPDVLWLRTLNPWSPDSPWSVQPPSSPPAPLTLALGDVAKKIAELGDGCVTAIVHDPPRISIAGELYSQEFYGQLARVLKRGGKMFHYTGAPHSVSRGRNLPSEVSIRLRRAGFKIDVQGDGIVAVR